MCGGSVDSILISKNAAGVEASLVDYVERISELIICFRGEAEHCVKTRPDTVFGKKPKQIIELLMGVPSVHQSENAVVSALEGNY